MFKFIKKLFSKKEAIAPALPPLEPKGVIAVRKSDLFTITLKHNGGESYEIRVMGNLSGNGSGVFRYGETRAHNHFIGECAMYGAK